MPALLLKARPTPGQLSDRTSTPLPDGIELYLDIRDIADQAAMDRAVQSVEALTVPPGFALLIEGPVGSLDGEFFDLARGSEADSEVIRRVTALAGRLRASAVNIHVIAPIADGSHLSERNRRIELERSLKPLGEFVERCLHAGAQPTIENMPPILRMRQGGFFYSAIGMPAEDLRWLCDRVSGLRSTLDLSHCGLYLRCREIAAGEAVREPGCSAALLDFVRQLPQVSGVLEYAETLGESLLTCHVSNATGLLGEGAPYASGDLDLDLLVGALADRVRYFVTETLEADNENAVEMRAALSAMRRILNRTHA